MTLAETALGGVWTGRDVAVAYRGPDRRRASAASAPVPSAKRFGAYLVGTQVVLGGTVALGAWSATGTPSQTSWLTPSVAVVSALAAGVSAVRWRVVGDAAAMWVASALLVYAGANIAFPDLLRSFTDTEADVSVVSVLRPSSVVVVMALLLLAAHSPRVDAGLTVRRVIASTTVVAAIAAAASALSVDVRLLFGPTIDRAPSEGTTALGQIGVGGLWLALAVVFLWRAKRNWTGADAWVGMMLIGLAEARLALAMSVNGDPAWLLASQVGRLLGMIAVLIGVVSELERSYVRQRRTLLTTDAELTSARARHAAERATAEERAHDLRSALAGIGSAAVTLERYHDELTVDERAGLARAVSAEIERLQQIVADARDERTSAGIADALDPVIRCARSQGVDVRADVHPELVATASGSELAEVVQNLLDNARRHAPGAPVELRARHVGNRVEVSVSDRGPGIDPTLGGRVFERGCHGGAPDSSGLGLYVASRLVRANGGELRVEDRHGGGATFSFSLPIDAGQEDR
jgi:two-component system OmpR family sensor kinase